MSGLVGYGSSDEEETNSSEQKGSSFMSFWSIANCITPQVLSKIQERPIDAPYDHNINPIPNDTPTSTADQSVRLQPSSITKESIHGPSVGPTELVPDSSNASPPYSNNRSMIQELTLPTHANLDIPLSPPDSPSPGLEQKISHFLSLKDQGIHFNTKLAASSALKNPSLLDKLIKSAGLNEEGVKDQYASTLPSELWDPNGFPASAYIGELSKRQQEMERKRSGERKGAERDFIAAQAHRHG